MNKNHTLDIPTADQLIPIIELPKAKPLEMLRAITTRRILNDQKQLVDGGKIILYFNKDVVKTVKKIIPEIRKKGYFVKWSSRAPTDPGQAVLAIEISIKFY